MRIRVDEIPEAGRTLRFKWEQDKLHLFVPPDDPFDLKLLGKVEVVLTLDRRPDHVRITGRIKGTLEVLCHRCLEAFPSPLDEEVDVFLVQEGRAGEEDEKELEAEELEYEFFDGEVIDIDRLVAEQVFLSLPVKVLCSEECKGICSRCGANLNQEDCRCAAKAESSPFAVLRSIKPVPPDSH